VREIFKTIVVLDFEYEVEAGGLLTVLCMVAYVLDSQLQHVRTIRLWRGDFGPKPPFDDDALIVAYSTWAEMTCYLQLNWRLPAHVFDLHTAFLAVSNIMEPFDYDDDQKRRKKGRGLVDACRSYNIQGWERFDKSTIVKDIAAGNWRIWGREAVFDYCEEDVR
jgi:hypothetical protein